ncbi:hypothetical protein F4604DRAFT_1676940 [Suillus subluteus]|nr:hypothetical protein F4604DRAFT_1676940 [Suillus subluteus]
MACSYAMVTGCTPHYVLVLAFEAVLPFPNGDRPWIELFVQIELQEDSEWLNRIMIPLLKLPYTKIESLAVTGGPATSNSAASSSSLCGNAWASKLGCSNPMGNDNDDDGGGGGVGGDSGGDWGGDDATVGDPLMGALKTLEFLHSTDATSRGTHWQKEQLWLGPNGEDAVKSLIQIYGREGVQAWRIENNPIGVAVESGGIMQQWCQDNNPRSAAGLNPKCSKRALGRDIAIDARKCRHSTTMTEARCTPTMCIRGCGAVAVPAVPLHLPHHGNAQYTIPVNGCLVVSCARLVWCYLGRAAIRAILSERASPGTTASTTSDPPLGKFNSKEHPWLIIWATGPGLHIEYASWEGMLPTVENSSPLDSGDGPGRVLHSLK